MTETADTTALRGELEKRTASPKEATVRDLLDRLEPRLAETLPAAIGVERFRRVALNELYRNPELYDCSPHSLVGALLYSAQLGLEPGPLGHVYLVPFKKQVTWILGYRGMIELAYRSGQLKDLTAVLVHEGDRFDYELGTSPKIKHVPDGPAGEREIVAAYSVARLKTGGAPFVVTFPEDWEKAQKASAAGRLNKGPWVEHRPAMILKTPIRRLQRFLPQTAGFAEAVTRDEAPAPEVDDVSGELEMPVSDAEPTEADA